jgi:large subunit ribosomal protein L3
VVNGLIGKKLGMTEVTDQAGRVRAVTVVALGPCVVSQLKTAATDGYEAVQISYGRKKPSRVRKPERGHFAKSEVAPGIAVGEFQRIDEEQLKLGQKLAASEVFKAGDRVDVRGVSKGHGYAGVIKRHHFAGFPGTHGTHEYFRHGGSIGNRSFPGRVFKGLRMAGQMGNRTATIPNLTVIEILPNDAGVLIAGALPGAEGSIVEVRHAVKHRRTEAERASG